MGTEAYSSALRDFVEITTAEVGETFKPRGSFINYRVEEAGVVVDAMCCHVSRLRATPEGVIDTTLRSSYSRGPFPLEGRLLQPDDDTALRLQRIVDQIRNAKENPRIDYRRTLHTH